MRNILAGSRFFIAIAVFGTFVSSVVLIISGTVAVATVTIDAIRDRERGVDASKHLAVPLPGRHIDRKGDPESERDEPYPVRPSPEANFGLVLRLCRSPAGLRSRRDHSRFLPRAGNRPGPAIGGGCL